jgi:hypothetical protein
MKVIDPRARAAREQIKANEAKVGLDKNREECLDAVINFSARGIFTLSDDDRVLCSVMKEYLIKGGLK